MDIEVFERNSHCFWLLVGIRRFLLDLGLDINILKLYLFKVLKDALLRIDDVHSVYHWTLDAFQIGIVGIQAVLGVVSYWPEFLLHRYPGILMTLLIISVHRHRTVSSQSVSLWLKPRLHVSFLVVVAFPHWCQVHGGVLECFLAESMSEASVWDVDHGIIPLVEGTLSFSRCDRIASSVGCPLIDWIILMELLLGHGFVGSPWNALILRYQASFVIFLVLELI